jgi:hypothetical protein
MVLAIMCGGIVLWGIAMILRRDRLSTREMLMVRTFAERRLPKRLKRRLPSEPWTAESYPEVAAMCGKYFVATGISIFVIAWVLGLLIHPLVRFVL